MKRSALLKKIKRGARLAGVEWCFDHEGANHGIMDQALEDVLGKGWWQK